MHICFVGEYPFKGKAAGGVGSYTYNIAQGYLKQGIKVSVVSFTKEFEGTETEKGIEITWINPAKLKGVNFIRNSYLTNKAIEKIHAKAPIDIIETAEGGLAFINKMPGIKYVIRLHGGHYFFSNTIVQKFSKWKAWQERRSFNKADACIGVSKFVLDKTSEFIKIDKNKSTVIYNPIDVSRFYESKPEYLVEGRIVFAGSLVEKKGIRQLIQAFQLVLDTHKNIHLEVYGRDTNTTPNGTSFMEYLKSIILPEALPNIHFKGLVSNLDMPAIVEKAEICVYPSHMEAMPVAWLEVMAMAKPFIAGNPGPGPEVIIDGEDGLLCNPFSPKDIAEKIIYMLNHKGKALEMGKKARAKILKTYELENIVQQNIQYFKQLIST